MDDFSSKFEKLEAAIDSGAAMTGFPKNLFEAYLSYKNASVHARVANGELVPSEGVARVGIYTEDGTYHEMKGEVMDIQKILVSVSAMVDYGHQVIFRKYDPHILLKSGRKLPLVRKSGVFVLPFYDAQRFQWQDNSL